jgi:hypothetical protein
MPTPDAGINPGGLYPQVSAAESPRLRCDRRRGGRRGFAFGPRTSDDTGRAARG